MTRPASDGPGPRSRYLPLLQELDDWQTRVAERHPGVVPCRLGCQACCRGPFDISVADALLIRDAVAALPPETQQALRARALDHVARMRAIEPGWEPPFDLGAIGDERFDRISDALADLPCPALDAHGGCTIYRFRPMICRLMGLGLRTDAGEVIENACPIQDEFPAYRELPPEPFALERFETREVTAQEEAAQVLFGTEAGAAYETTVAGAIALATGG
ncbi:MAG: YkgJ family cysteine cluster protein [Gemmatimonadales bacterium]